MRQILTLKNQTVFDIAVQEYGNIETAFIILEDNPHLAGANELPDGYELDQGIDLDISYPIAEGTTINIQEGLEAERTSVKKQIDKVIS